MFKKFSPVSDLAGQTQCKTSTQRSIRAAILRQWRIGSETLETIWSAKKKEPFVQVRCKNGISIYTVNSEPIFFQPPDGPFLPTLRLLHKYPDLLPRVQIDRGAIPFFLSGASMMCPGLTSAGGYLPPADDALPKGTPVAIYAEGKEHAAGLGITKMGTEEMRQVNKGVAVETVTYLGDDLWKVQNL